jgi:ATPase subunit of ABC transporter with duplicated ATPase domains
MLTVSQLSKSFAGRALFDDVSLQVNRGDLIGLVRGRPQRVAIVSSAALRII